MQQTMRGIAPINFYADDITAAKEWYTELLGLEPYFERPRQGPPEYIEFYLGDFQHELGIIDRKLKSKDEARMEGTAVYWHVDDVAVKLEKVKKMGATVYEPLKKCAGFVTASVVDPFGNILGIVYNPTYAEILESSKRF